MTQTQYDCFIKIFQDRLTEAEAMIAKLESRMASIEECLKEDRENGLWVSYGEDIDRLGDLVRDHRNWIGRRNSYREALSTGKAYRPEIVEE